MTSKSFGLLFYLKKPRNENQKERSIFLRITVDGAFREMSIHRTCSKDRWNQHSGRAIVNKTAGRRTGNTDAGRSQTAHPSGNPRIQGLVTHK
jgi:hypothetical protein